MDNCSITETICPYFYEDCDDCNLYHTVEEVKQLAYQLEEMKEMNRNNRGFFELCEDTRTCNKICEENEECTDECAIQKAINKLGEYEDLEEQGLLLRLPCKVGDTVYIIRETQMCCYRKTCDKDISCKECIMLNTHEIHETKFDLSYFYEFGKSVFLTKEEAEQALKKEEKARNSYEQ